MASDKQQKKIGKVMGEYKDGKLKSSSGQKVTDRKQATAIALSEAKAPKKKARLEYSRDGKSMHTKEY